MFLDSGKGAFWGLGSLAAAVALSAFYVHRLRLEAPSGGTTLGLVLGFLALGLILLLMAFGVRKRRYKSTLGTLSGWLQAHIYLGLLVVVVVVLHAGFQFRDTLATAAFWCLLLVVASGLIGVVGYSVVPRLLTDVESNLTAQQISDELNRLAESMGRLAAGKSEAFTRIYQRLLEEGAPRRLAGWRILPRRVSRAAVRNEDQSRWSPLLKRVPETEREALSRLLVLSRQHKELHLSLIAQQRYRNLLDVWLFVHLPLSFVLLLLVAAHVLAVFYYAW